MPSVAVAFVATCLCMAENFGTAITPAWLLTMIVVTGLLSLAMPPIPGGALTCYTVMLTRAAGIPGEALALAVAINSMIDFIATASNRTRLQVEVTTVASRAGNAGYRMSRRASGPGRVNLRAAVPKREKAESKMGYEYLRNESIIRSKTREFFGVGTVVTASAYLVAVVGLYARSAPFWALMPSLPRAFATALWMWRS